MNVQTQLGIYLHTEKCNEFVDLLKQNSGINLNIQSDHGNYTFLQTAVFYGQFECVEAIIKYSVNNTELLNDYGETALMIAARNFKQCINPEKIAIYYQIIRYLVENGASCNIVCKGIPVECNFVKHSPFITICEALCIRTHIVYAAELIKLFLSHGVNRNQISMNGYTAESYLRSKKLDSWASYIRDFNYQSQPMVIN